MKRILILSILIPGITVLTSLVSDENRKQLTLQVQIVYKMAWGGMGHHFKARVIRVDDPEFLMTELSFDTYSSPVFEELEKVAGKETHLWEYGDPAMVSNNYTTPDIYAFELSIEVSEELHEMPQDDRRYAREYFYEPVRDIYWKITSVKRLP